MGKNINWDCLRANLEAIEIIRVKILLEIQPAIDIIMNDIKNNGVKYCLDGMNPSAIDLIRDDVRNDGVNIYWYYLCQNPAIFTTDLVRYKSLLNKTNCL